VGRSERRVGARRLRALAAAIEMPRIALAPNFDLLRKPSPTVPVSISHICKAKTR